MSSLDLSRLTPDDAQVALRSFPRRYRAELAPGPVDDELDELAARLGPGGESALDVVSDVTRTWGLLGHELRRTLTDDEPMLHPATLDRSKRRWETPSAGSVDEALELLGHESDELVDVIASVGTVEDWARSAPVAGGGSTTALDLVKEAVRVGAEGLDRLDLVLTAVRRG
jgi:hypothetical protein